MKEKTCETCKHTKPCPCWDEDCGYFYCEKINDTFTQTKPCELYEEKD